MSKSKKKAKENLAEQASVKKDVPIQDDPYWEVSNIYLDSHRLGRYATQFDKFEEKRPEWTSNLISGVPTYYCVLGVGKGATNEQIEQAYDQKKELSCYPDTTLEEAFEVLSDPKLQAEYDKLLAIFKQITKCMPPLDKIELIREHNSYIKSEKDYDRMVNLLGTYKQYQILYVGGMPDFYELLQVAQDSPAEDINKYANSDSGLLRMISNLLSDPASRADYDFILYFSRKYMNEQHCVNMVQQKEKWNQIDDTIMEKIIYSSLHENSTIFKDINRMNGINNANQDWKDYVPPNETFFSILGVEMDSLTNKDKKEVESILRDKYRTLEKTAQVNLAYSMLKNISKRDDYLWFAKNYEWLNILDDLTPEGNAIYEDDDDDDDDLIKMMDDDLIKMMNAALRKMIENELYGKK